LQDEVSMSGFKSWWKRWNFTALRKVWNCSGITQPPNAWWEPAVWWSKLTCVIAWHIAQDLRRLYGNVYLSFCLFIQNLKRHMSLFFLLGCWVNSKMKWKVIYGVKNWINFRSEKYRDRRQDIWSAAIVSMVWRGVSYRWHIGLRGSVTCLLTKRASGRPII
jgi:hypothetical protein